VIKLDAVVRSGAFVISKLCKVAKYSKTQYQIKIPIKEKETDIQTERNLKEQLPQF